MYKAIVCHIKTRPFPNADRLLLGDCLGNQVVVGLDTQDNALGLFFPTDGQLSPEFCAAHDLIARTDEHGQKAGGYFAANRRVRAQKFRGERSDGFWVPLTYLAFTGRNVDTLRAGDQLDSFGGVPICNKYVTRATATAQGEKKINSRRETEMFRMHFETEQFRYFADSIPPGALIIITEKLHGTSHRLGHVLDQKELSWPAALAYRLWNFFEIGGREIDTRTWAVLHGSRRVILDGALTDSFYGEAFRGKAVGALAERLRKGEVVYGEIVGWVNEAAPIMEPQATGDLKDKKLVQLYGAKMIYAYGLPAGECKFYVYRIVQTNEDGHAVELSHYQMLKRCEQLGVATVPLLVEPFIYDGNAEALRQHVETLCDGPSTLDLRHIREGVCVRVEHPGGTAIYKNKSFAFGVLEGYLYSKWISLAASRRLA